MIIDEQTTINDITNIGFTLDAAGFVMGPRLFSAFLRMAAMGAVSTRQGWTMSKEEFVSIAGRFYDWAHNRKYHVQKLE